MKIEEYMVAEETNLSDFEKQIYNLICEKWQPFGGVTVCCEWRDNVEATVYYQAMVKYESHMTCQAVNQSKFAISIPGSEKEI